MPPCYLSVLRKMVRLFWRWECLICIFISVSPPAQAVEFDTQVDVEYEYYTFLADSIFAAHKHMLNNQRQHNRGMAHVRCSIETQYTTRQQSGIRPVSLFENALITDRHPSSSQCDLQRVKLLLNVKYQLPKWVNADEHDHRTQNWWHALYDRIHAHEERHHQYCEQYLEEFTHELRGLGNFNNCQEVRQAITTVELRHRQNMNNRHDNFDREDTPLVNQYMLELTRYVMAR